MKKLNFLKTIVDYLWVVSLIVFPLLIFDAIICCIDKNSAIPIKVAGVAIVLGSVSQKAELILQVLNFVFLVFALYYFRKLLGLFKQKQIFDDSVIIFLNKVGVFVMIFAAVGFAISFIFRIFERNIVFYFGTGSFLIPFAIGLFFTVLSEVFKIGKHLKSENDLTI